uniref:DNA2/NAM7 helicase helicase domain-containing protein n=1 Tax=Chromera velia CCMP2878 TaxID=1169474 RepID=A0A0G4F2Y8_9ALVE|eukprot:Cvel_14752.t1-p1 / transcript=Cvel_14752.t1 / gene=Cvel_14752 / organism=Chromera_velia_CCMP2878 / gene_product=NFX1-type zinc finger-containing protein 1, putative / transcript_product=NFX1-type zinc finger-containing protein 1, putative / location=Cvel_scaffold1061:43511-44143(-) / protein_length=211 / sequence_SO=supercontig / SO=protein_coding / is_pseudo=false
MTITNACIQMDLLRELQPTVCIVEEAAEISEPALRAALPPSVKHLILIGDHEQLRPPVNSYDLVLHNRFDVSMFERLLQAGLRGNCQLSMQNRMHPEISRLLLDIYPHLRDNHSRVSEIPLPFCLRSSPSARHAIWWDHAHPELGDLSEGGGGPSSTSKSNSNEAELCVRLALLIAGNCGMTVTILAAYVGQKILIRRRVEDFARSDSRLA